MDRIAMRLLACGVSGLLSCVAHAQTGSGGVTLPNHTPPYVASAPDLGPEDPAQALVVRLWLQLHQPDALTTRAQAVLAARAGRPSEWLTPEEFRATYAPSAGEIAAVKKFLTSNGFTVLEQDPSERYVSAQGTVALAQRAFHVAIHNFKVDGKVIRSNTTNPSISDDVGALIQRIGGLSNRAFSPRVLRPIDPETKAPFLTVPVAMVTAGGTYETQCFRDAQTVKFTSADGTTTATYQGNRFGADLTNVAPNLAPCGYGPSTLHKAYGMNDLYRRGLDGSGQTVVIIDAFGSPNTASDAAAFVTTYQLPPLDLKILQPFGSSISGPWSADQQGWALETGLDVEYSHTIAPGAKVVLVEALTDSDDDLIAGVSYAVDHQLGNVISNSWGDYESLVDQSTSDLYDSVLKKAAVTGVSVNFASGDYGDNVLLEGYFDVAFPASPYLTSVGGTTLALNADQSIRFQAGWGNTETRVGDGTTSVQASVAEQNPPTSPPLTLGFLFGSSGGASRVYRKPPYQRSIEGQFRMQPDVAFLGDPYTGVEVVETGFDANGNPLVGAPAVSILGGTSLACPMFSALWSIANQSAGGASGRAEYSLGISAPLLYQLPEGAVTDIVPYGSANNVTGTFVSGGVSTSESALALAVPETPAAFYSALYDNPTSPNRWDVISFGADSSLATTPGWDPVTGVGVPNPAAFVRALTW